MSTKITVVTQEKTTPFGSISHGGKFMDPSSGSNTPSVYMKISNLYEVKSDNYLKNAVNLSTGKALEVPENKEVILVDLEIKAIK